jgi:Mrp family chromosome partitioning ATPase
MKRRKRVERRESSEDWGDEFALTLSAEGSMPFMTFSAPVVEAIRYLLGRLTRQGVLPERLALTSTLRQEGVTYISRALGTVMANDLPVNVCVVEMNWWWPAAVPPGAPFTRGLGGLLRGETTLEEALVRTSRPNLTLLPARQVDLVSRPVFARSQQLLDVLGALNERYDYVLLDIPALQATSDALHLASLGEAAALVVRQGATPLNYVQQALDELSFMPVVGTILNDVKLATPEWARLYVP